MADTAEGETDMRPVAIHQRVIDLPVRPENKTEPGAARARMRTREAGGYGRSVSPERHETVSRRLGGIVPVPS